MVHALQKTYALLMDYLDDPKEAILLNIIAELEQQPEDFNRFISQYKLLLSTPEQELDIVSQLDIMYEEAFSKPESTKMNEKNKLGEDALDLLDDFVEEANEQLITIVDSLLGVESEPNRSKELITLAFRAMHTI